MVLDGIAFTAPTGLEDRTHYVHRAEGPREELTVELELPVGAATPAVEVLVEQREAMAGFLDAAFGVEAEGDTTAASAPAAGCLAPRAKALVRLHLLEQHRHGAGTVCGKRPVCNGP